MGAPGSQPSTTAGTSPSAEDGLSTSSIIEVYAAHASPNFLHPYQGVVPEFSHSTAFVVDGSLLLTNAHCVAYATHVQVKRRDQDTWSRADVICIGYECDLALLSVREEAFWKGIGEPITFMQGLPATGDSVTVLGFGMGGDSLCTTKGVVSRINVLPYPQSRRQGPDSVRLPVIQIDAAINPGNSGGPALSTKSSKVAVGVVFMGLTQAQNVGFIIPAKVVRHFLEDFRRHGKFTHFASPPFQWQNLATKDMRAYFQTDGKGGVRVNSVDPDVDSGLRVDDVVVKLFGEPIGYDGKVTIKLGSSETERVSLHYLFCDKFVGTRCDCVVLRNGQEVELGFELSRMQHLIDMDMDAQSEYIIVAGLVIQPLTSGYFSSANAWHTYVAQNSLRNKWLEPVKDRQVLAVTDVFSHEVNSGLGVSRGSASPIKNVNKVPVRNLRHLSELVDSVCADPSDPWLVIEFTSRKVFAVRAKAAKEATADLLLRHGVRVDRRLVPLQSNL